jgi:hypothetical protein
MLCSVGCQHTYGQVALEHHTALCGVLRDREQLAVQVPLYKVREADRGCEVVSISGKARNHLRECGATSDHLS